MSRHLIHTQKLDLQYSQPAQAKADLDRWGAWYDRFFLPVIGEVLDELEIPGKTIRIERLEVDLGKITGRLDPDVLRKKLKEALKIQILMQTPELQLTISSDPEQASTLVAPREEQKDLELLIYLLDNGRKPWWASPSKKMGIRSLVQKLFRQEKNQSLTAWLASQSLTTQASERLANHVSYSELVALMAWVFPDTTRSWKIFAESIGDSLTPEFYSASEMERLLSKVLIESFLVKKSEPISSFSLWVRTSPVFFRGKKIQKSEVFRPLIGLFSVWEKQNPSKSSYTKLAEKWIQSPFIAQFSALPKPLSGEETLLLTRESADLSMTKLGRESTFFEKPAPFSSKKRPPARALELDETFPVSNAGLVLAAPFLLYFFRGLGLVEQKKFVSENSQNRAALLIQALLEESTTYEESDLLLNKILCGIEPQQPIPVDFAPSDLERAEIINLLDSMVAQWTALKSSSGQSMAQGFFRREGSLRKVEKGYQLLIPRTSIDILLNRLPWTISIIKLPWMNETLFVEW